MKKSILIIVLCLACVASFAQRSKKKKRTRKPARTTQQVPSRVSPADNTTSSVPAVDTANKIASAPAKPFDRPLDGYYKNTKFDNARVTPYPAIRAADVAYKKRIWREIDVREKMNQYLASPKMRLIDVILGAVDSGELTAYDPLQGVKGDIDGDSFGTPLSPAAARKKLVDSSLVNTLDKDGNIASTKMVAGEFNEDSTVLKFRIKEDWIFDKQRSVFEPRIIGIAPMIKVKIPGVAGGGEYQPAFWIYFPDARPIFATKEAVNRNNDATGLSLDDVFNKRLFTSYIVKESNDKNERIKDYITTGGIDRLYESERIKKSLLDWELNLWQY